MPDELLPLGLPDPVVLPASPTSPRQARILVKSALGAVLTREDLADTLLMTTELVTNAVATAGNKCLLTISMPAHGFVRIAVADLASQLPEVVHAEPGDVHGRGMLLVASLSREWGVEPAEPTGKTVWFEMPLAEPQ